MNEVRGSVSIVGAGPGDPDLITVRGRDRLAGAEVVIHDELAGRGLLELCAPNCVRFDVGKRCGGRATPQDRIIELMIRHARAGRRVVRLKGGDPFVFGRGGEEIAALLQAGISCEVVPGVTAATAAAAAAGVPLTQRGIASAVVFVTGHGASDAAIDWAAYARLNATLCLYMGTRNLADIAGRLAAGGLAIDTPVAVISRASWPDQRIWPGALGDLALGLPAEIETPALAIIGEVARTPAAAGELASLAALTV